MGEKMQQLQNLQVRACVLSGYVLGAGKASPDNRHAMTHPPLLPLLLLLSRLTSH
jgi:hypothetical protein